MVQGADLDRNFALPDCHIHAPNERLRAEYVPLGIAAARELYLELAALCAGTHANAGC